MEEQPISLEIKIALLEQTVKTILENQQAQQEQTKALTELVYSVKLLALGQEATQKDLEVVKQEVVQLKEKPADTWATIKSNILSTVITVIATAITSAILFAVAIGITNGPK